MLAAGRRVLESPHVQAVVRTPAARPASVRPQSHRPAPPARERRRVSGSGARSKCRVRSIRARAVRLYGSSAAGGGPAGRGCRPPADRPWRGTARQGARRRPPRRDNAGAEGVEAFAEVDATLTDGHRGDGDDLVAPQIEPRRVEIDHAVLDRTPLLIQDRVRHTPPVRKSQSAPTTRACGLPVCRYPPWATRRHGVSRPEPPGGRAPHTARGDAVRLLEDTAEVRHVVEARRKATSVTVAAPPARVRSR